MKKIVLLLSLFFVLAPFAAQATSMRATGYKCYLVEDFDDWSLSLDFVTRSAVFFDNDHNSKLYLVENSEQVLSPEPVYVFEGHDSMYPTSKIRVRFSINTLSATLVDDVGTGDEDSFAFKCSPNLGRPRQN